MFNPVIGLARSRSADAVHRPALVSRERVLSTAYDLFSRRGIRGVGINELIETSGVAKSTFYRHFPSKDDLVKAVLALQHEVWFEEVVAEAQRRSDTAEEELRSSSMSSRTGSEAEATNPTCLSGSSWKWALIIP